jgi:GT2 family glycosyltransferase
MEVKPSDSNKIKPLLAYKDALILQQEMEINELKKQIKSKSIELELTQASISFKFGLFITYPIRLIFELFSRKNSLKINPIIVSCDKALFASDTIEISGWALSPNNIQKIEIYDGLNLIGLCNLNYLREDVNKAFPDMEGSLKSGFYFRKKHSPIEKVIKLKIFDFKNNIVEINKVILPTFASMSLNTQYYIFLSYQKDIELIENTNNTNIFKFQPLISIIIPVFNVGSKWLNNCIHSIQNQIYQNWQLCLYDDASNSEETLNCLKSWQGKDDRIYIKFGKDNLGISLASNEAIKMANGEFIGLLDHDDELSLDALYEVVKSLNEKHELDFIYSDEDKIEEDGSFSDPHFKSDFNLDTLLSHNYICHFSVIRKSIGDKIGWFRHGYEGSQDYDLFLRVASITNKIHHIPKVLYHWRKIEGSTAIAIDNKNYAVKAGRKALKNYLLSNNINATVEAGLFINSFRIKREITKQASISIIIPFRDQFELLKTCVDSIINKTRYKDYQVLLIDNQSNDSNVINFCKKLTQQNNKFQLHHFDEEFNYSRLNNWAVSRTTTDYILFLNNDIEVVNEDWLESMVEHIQRDEVGAVGAKLLYEDNSIQHAGVIVNKIGALHVNKGLKDGENGYFERANYIQNVSACTAACLLVKKRVFLEVGGFDEENFKIAYNDVDLCLKMRQAGYLITYTPYAKLYHYESKSRGLDTEPEKLERFTREIKNYQEKWGEIYKDGDPYFNPNLLPTSERIMLNIKQ